MDFKYLFVGIVFFVVGLIMFNDVKKRKPASEETKWKGQLLPEYINFYTWSIALIIFGIVIILKSIAN